VFFFDACTICPSFAQYVPMSWPSYPDRDYQQRKKFGLYLEPSKASFAWGVRVHGVESFESRANDMSAAGRVLNVYALVLVQKGCGLLVSQDGKTTKLKEGDVLMVVPGWWHLYNPDKKAGWTTSWVIFDGPVAETLEAEGEIVSGVIASDIGEIGLKSLGAIIDGMVSLVLDRSETLYLHARLAAEMLSLLARIFDWRGQQSYGGSCLQVDEAIHYVEAHFSEEIDFDVLRDRLGMSPTHFRRLFKKATGEGPQTYQKRLRVRLAKELLRHTQISISEVAMRVGYPKNAYFSRVFSQRVGMSPSVWRASGG